MKGMPVGVVHSLWAGLAILTKVSLISTFVYSQHLDTKVWIGMGLVAAGIMLINLSWAASLIEPQVVVKAYPFRFTSHINYEQGRWIWTKFPNKCTAFTYSYSYNRQIKPVTIAPSTSPILKVAMKAIRLFSLNVVLTGGLFTFGYLFRFQRLRTNDDRRSINGTIQACDAIAAIRMMQASADLPLLWFQMWLA